MITGKAELSGLAIRRSLVAFKRAISAVLWVWKPDC